MSSGSYIIVLQKTAAEEDVESVIQSVGATAKHKYNMGTFKGFAADLTDEQLEKVTANPKVDFFEADGQVSAYAAGHAKKK